MGISRETVYQYLRLSTSDRLEPGAFGADGGRSADRGAGDPPPPPRGPAGAPFRPQAAYGFDRVARCDQPRHAVSNAARRTSPEGRVPLRPGQYARNAGRRDRTPVRDRRRDEGPVTPSLRKRPWNGTNWEGRAPSSSLAGCPNEGAGLIWETETPSEATACAALGREGSIGGRRIVLYVPSERIFEANSQLGRVFTATG
jgi:hypothetical protein